MRDRTCHRSATLPRGLVASVLGVLVTSGFFSLRCAAEAPGSADVSTHLAKVEQILRQAGASSADVTWVEENQLRGGSPEDLAEYADYLEKKTPDEMAEDGQGDQIGQSVFTWAGFAATSRRSGGDESRTHSCRVPDFSGFPAQAVALCSGAILW